MAPSSNGKVALVTRAASSMGRAAAQPEEMAELLIWLCSDSPSLVAVSALSIDGGICAKEKTGARSK
jgi:NAD(P)-dependent dehydrogenase (short-subunit alcohol dehydrogenase family)